VGPGTGAQLTNGARRGEAVEGMEEQDRQQRAQWMRMVSSTRNTDSLEGVWGDTFTQKQKNTVRVYLQNIRGLPTDDEDGVKYTDMRHFITLNKIDIIALLESSTHWGEMKYEQRLPECTKGWWESMQWSTAYNKLEEHLRRHQPGGTVLGIFNELVHRASRPGMTK